MSYSIQIVKYENIKPFIEYVFLVTNKETNQSWNFKRRYSALHSFYENCKRVVGGLPHFPKKKIFGNKNPAFLEQRRIQLESYFNRLAEIPSLVSSSVFKDFIMPLDKTMGTQVKHAPIVEEQVPRPHIKLDQKLGSEMQEIVEEVSCQFINISNPFEPDDFKNKANNDYENFLRTELQGKVQLPESTRDFDPSQPVFDAEWIERAFANVWQTYESAALEVKILNHVN